MKRSHTSVIALFVLLTIGSGYGSAQVEEPVPSDQVRRQVRKILSEARRLLGPSENDEVKYEILVSLAEAGDPAAAVEFNQLLTQRAEMVAEAIEKDSSVLEDAWEVIAAMAESGRMNYALQLIEAIKNPAWKGALISPVAQAYAETGDRATAELYFQQAVRLVTTSQVEAEKARGFVSIARTQVAVGDDEGALQTLLQISSDKDKALVLEDISRRRLKEGDIGAALETVSLMRDMSQKAYSLIWIAQKQAEVAGRKPALETAGKAHFIAKGMPDGKEY
ncbi:MAG: hypothetical protein IH793_10150, partial [Acidobacteria bacterium]|nr:hypothetical protein [Acidobacteriota bacterium]